MNHLKPLKNLNKIEIIFGIILFLLILNICSLIISAEENQNQICAVYITGIGCPNCAITDPVLLSEYTASNPNLIIIEYEIYDLRASNQDIARKYFDSYIPNTRAGVPLIIFNKNQVALGRFQVLDSKEIIKSLDSNNYPLPDGSSVDFSELDITNLQGKVKIWTKNRVLISGNKGNNELLKNLLITEEIGPLLENTDFKEIDPEPVQVSDGQIEFSHAVKINDWILQWNGKSSSHISEISPDREGVNLVTESPWKSWYWILIMLSFIIISFLIYKFKIIKKCMCICLTEKQKNYLIIAISLLFLIGFFILGIDPIIRMN